MLIAMNNDCKGAKAKADAAELNPNIVAKNVPAQVGHPVKRAVIAPKLLNQLALAFLGLLSYANTARAILIPTSADTISNSVRLSGIINNPNCSVIYVKNIGT